MVEENSVHGEELDKLCWMLVNNIIDFEHRLYEYMTDNDFDDVDVDVETEKEYCAGFMNGQSLIAEMLIEQFDIDIVERARSYTEDSEVDLVPLWVEQEGYSPDPRYEKTFKTLNQDLIDEYENRSE